MAIKNTKLGGTDWTSEELLSADLNDTMDASSMVVFNPVYQDNGINKTSATTSTALQTIKTYNLATSDFLTGGIIIRASGRFSASGFPGANMSISIDGTPVSAFSPGSTIIGAATMLHYNGVVDPSTTHTVIIQTGKDLSSNYYFTTTWSIQTF